VQAINLATNDTINLQGNETLNMFNSTNGVSFVQYMKGSIFPNPCNGSATLQFATSAVDAASIQIVNASGQLVLGEKQVLSIGAHHFAVKFPGPGMYVVLDRICNQVLSFKEVANVDRRQESSLSYFGNSQLSIGTSTFKNATTGKNLNYSAGNKIIYTFPNPCHFILYSAIVYRIKNNPICRQTHDHGSALH
jgi:hypothetical protein